MMYSALNPDSNQVISGVSVSVGPPWYDDHPTEMNMIKQEPYPFQRRCSVQTDTQLKAF